MQRYSRHHGDFVFQICVSIAFGKEDLAIGYYHNFGTGHLVSSELNRENPVKKASSAARSCTFVLWAEAADSANTKTRRTAAVQILLINSTPSRSK